MATVTVAALLVCRSRLLSSVRPLIVPPAAVPVRVVPLCTVALPSVPPRRVRPAESLRVVLTFSVPPDKTMAALLVRLLMVSVAAAEWVMVVGEVTLMITSSVETGVVPVLQLPPVFQLLSPAAPVHVMVDRRINGSRSSSRGRTLLPGG